MQRLEVSCAVRRIYTSLGVKELSEGGFRYIHSLYRYCRLMNTALAMTVMVQGELKLLVVLERTDRYVCVSIFLVWSSIVCASELILLFAVVCLRTVHKFDFGAGCVSNTQQMATRGKDRCQGEAFLTGSL